MNDLKPTVRSLLSECLQVSQDEITIDLEINGIWQWDSLAHLELMMHLEAAFGLEIDEATILDCSTVRGLQIRLGLEF